jgi:hypothetical protein
MMLRLMQLRSAAIAVVAAAVLSSTAVSAWAFTREDVQSGGSGNSTFADPDSRTVSPSQGAQPFGLNGPTVQFGAQQGPSITTYGRFQGNGYNGPSSDPYFRSLGNGN